jgi:hypothetical protein
MELSLASDKCIEGEFLMDIKKVLYILTVAETLNNAFTEVFPMEVLKWQGNDPDDGELFF